MTVLSGRTLSALNKRGAPIVRPFNERTRSHGMTYGVGPAGYDIRIREKMRLDSGQFRLGSSIERFNMPDDVIGFVYDKSTWARRGLSLFNTVIEPGWEGFLTLELINHGREALWIDDGMPIAQIVFHYLDEEAVPYEGKYQNQPALPIPAIHEVAYEV